jgi:hypothetical protein
MNFTFGNSTWTPYILWKDGVFIIYTSNNIPVNGRNRIYWVLNITILWTAQFFAYPQLVLNCNRVRIGRVLFQPKNWVCWSVLTQNWECLSFKTQKWVYWSVLTQKWVCWSVLKQNWIYWSVLTQNWVYWVCFNPEMSILVYFNPELDILENR